MKSCMNFTYIQDHRVTKNPQLLQPFRWKVECGIPRTFARADCAREITAKESGEYWTVDICSS